MAWTVEIAADAVNDLSLIFDHLLKNYMDLGEPDDVAFERAAARVTGIQDSVLGLAKNPYRGTLREEMGKNLRNITINKAIIWFQLDEERQSVRILAFFFGGQDHMRHMMRRMLDG